MKGIRGLLEKDFRLFFRQGGNLFFVLAFVALFFTLTEKQTATFIAIYIPRWKIFSCNCNCGVIFKSCRKCGDQFCLYLYYKCNGNLFWKYN